MHSNLANHVNSSHFNYSNYESSPINNQSGALPYLNNVFNDSTAYNNSLCHDSATSSNSSNSSIVYKETTHQFQAIKTSRASQKRPGIHHQALPKEAVNELNNWFESHINHPYPTTEEKSVLANKYGITFKQVNSWLCNRRNRTMNTKPKRVKRQLQTEISNVFNELTTSSNQSKAIEKLYSLLL